MCRNIGVSFRPDTCASVKLVASGKEDTTKAEFDVLKKLINRVKDTKKMGLEYVLIEMEDASLMLVTDSSFANSRDEGSQLGFVVLLEYRDGKTNIIHYGSKRNRRVAK